MEKMLDKKSRDFAKNMRDTMIYDKGKNEVQIGTDLYVNGKITSAVESAGKVYLHNIYLNGNNEGYIKLYTTNNEPFTKETLTSFMANNGITGREKGFPVCCNSALAKADNVTKILLFNFIVYVSSNYLVISSEGITFNIVESNVTLTRNINPYYYVSAITDTVIEL